MSPGLTMAKAWPAAEVLPFWNSAAQDAADTGGDPGPGSSHDEGPVNDAPADAVYIGTDPPAQSADAMIMMIAHFVAEGLKVIVHPQGPTSIPQEPRSLAKGFAVKSL